MMGPARTLRLGRLALLLAALTGLGAAGCARGPAAIAPVTGKVAYRGTALQGGIIVFAPDTARGESGKVVCAAIGPDGSYVLQTGDAQGAPAGWYRVTVASLAPAPQAAGQLPAAVSVLPEKYRDPDLSMLACEVKASRANQLDFNLD